MDRPRNITLSKSVDAAVTFQHLWANLDPRTMYANGAPIAQHVAICILRPLCKGRRETYTAVAIHNPADRYNERKGQAIALGRAIEQATGEDAKTAYHMARRWFWEQDQAAEVAALNAPAEVAA